MNISKVLQRSLDHDYTIILNGGKRKYCEKKWWTLKLYCERNVTLEKYAETLGRQNIDILRKRKQIFSKE